MKILIIGAGIGGLTLAAFLKDSSIDFDIVEKAADWHTQGFSLGLWNNGRNILAKLGLADKFDKEGSRIRYYRVCDGQGKVLRKFDLSEFYSEYGLAYTHVSRESLHDWFIELVDKDKIQLNTQVTNIEQLENGATVTFLSGETKHYDLVVGADGIHSKVRSLFFGDECESFDNWRVWYAWIDNKYKQDATVTEYIEAGEFVGVFDVGEKTLAVLIAPVEHKVWDDVKERLMRLAKTFEDEHALSGFLANLKDEDVVPTDLSHVILKTLIKGNVVLVGDAAHGFEPHAGLGASMAMEDGYVLAGELMKVSAQYPLAQALKNYEVTRKKRVAIARSLTNRMRAWAFIRSRVARSCVNFVIPFIPQSFFTKRYHRLLGEEI